jgi:hypothetical protein
MRLPRLNGIRNSEVGAVVVIASVTLAGVVVAVAPEQLLVPVAGLNAPVASDGSPVHVKVRGRAVTWLEPLPVTKPFELLTVRLIEVPDPATTE